MDQCIAFQYCGLDDSADPEHQLCILHSFSLEKDKNLFLEAFNKHRKEKGDNFFSFVFPVSPQFKGGFDGNVSFFGATFREESRFHETEFRGNADFSATTFEADAIFSKTMFKGLADFGHATFKGAGKFGNAIFEKDVRFESAEFTKSAEFLETIFKGITNFGNCEFRGESRFMATQFHENALFRFAEFSARPTFIFASLSKADFSLSTFNNGANFAETMFKVGPFDFLGCKFLGKTNFTARADSKAPAIFADAEANFGSVLVEPPESLVFKKADLGKVRFLDTDLRKTEFTDVTWPREHGSHGRFAVYDEIASNEQESPWGRIERLCSDLKLNYEDRHDYARAGDFHYGEKEMQRKNPVTPLTHRLFLAGYKFVSGYGEKYLPPLVLAFVLFFVCTCGYLAFGLRPKDPIHPEKINRTLQVTKLHDWPRAAHYSFRVMTLLKPDDYLPLGFAKTLVTIETLAGPVLLGFFALALRQRLKR